MNGKIKFSSLVSAIPACPETFFVVLSIDVCIQKDSRNPKSFRNYGNDVSATRLGSHISEKEIAST